MIVRSFHRIALGLLSAGMAASLLLPMASAQDTGSEVVAVVNGQPITKQDFTIAYTSLPPRVRQQGMEVLYPHVLELLIQRRLIVAKAQESKLAEEPEVIARLKRIEEQLIGNLYLEREIGKKLSEEVLLAEYEKFLADNPPQQEVRARHILLNSEAEAREIITLIGQGQPFAELAKTRSKGPSSAQGGDLGFFPRGKMVQAFEDVAFALEPNTYSIDPVQTRFGWHVILVEEKRTVEPPSLEQIRPRLINALAQSMAEDVKREIVKNATIQRFDLNGKSIEPPAQVLPELLDAQ